MLNNLLLDGGVTPLNEPFATPIKEESNESPIRIEVKENRNSAASSVKGRLFSVPDLRDPNFFENNKACREKLSYFFSFFR